MEHRKLFQEELRSEEAKFEAKINGTTHRKNNKQIQDNIEQAEKTSSVTFNPQTTSVNPNQLATGGTLKSPANTNTT